MNEPETIRALLAARSIAVVGLSDDPSRPSYYVSAAMQRAGYRIYPVNPRLTEVLGERCYSSLSLLPLKPDLVNVFRLPRHVPAIVEEMLELGLRGIWLQQGVIHPDAIATAERAGIRVVADRCLMVEAGRQR